MNGIKLDITRASASLSDLHKQIPFMAATALNDVAFQVQRAENEAIGGIFDNPRPFTERATQVEKATKANLEAVVSLRPAQAKYLNPYEDGGEHASSWKMGNLLVPVDGPTDKYGQITKGTLRRLRDRKDVFRGTVNGVTGIWQRPSSKGRRAEKKTGLKLLFVWRPNDNVQKRLDFKERGEQIVRTNGPAAIAKALQRVLATAFR